jgi:hypothetical protein
MKKWAWNEAAAPFSPPLSPRHAWDAFPNVTIKPIKLAFVIRCFRQGISSSALFFDRHARSGQTCKPLVMQLLAAPLMLI